MVQEMLTREELATSLCQACSDIIRPLAIIDLANVLHITVGQCVQQTHHDLHLAALDIH